MRSTEMNKRDSYEKLELTKQQYLKGPTDYHRSDFYHALVQAAQTFTDNPNPARVPLLVDCKLLHLKVTLLQSSMPHNYHDYIKDLMGFLLNNNALPYITSNPENEKILAGVCIANAMLSKQNVLDEDKRQDTLVENWFNVKITDDTMKNLPKLVDLFYGPGLWPLYGSDIKRELSAHSILFKLDFPVIKRNNVAKPYNAVDTTLPADIT